MHKLTGEQCKVLYLPDDINLAILGSAGSGKSLIALCKAIYFLIKYPDKKCALVCFNNPIIEKMKLDFDSIILDLEIEEKVKNSIKERIVIETYYSFINGVINEINRNHDFFMSNGKNDKLVALKSEKRDKLIEEIVDNARSEFSEKKILTRDLKFFQDEISWLQGMEISTLEEYQNAERIGRGHKDPVSRGVEREILYHIFKEYKEIRKNRLKRLFDFNDISWLMKQISNYLLESDKFDFLIIDEFQDLDKSKIKALISLIKTDGRVLLLGDYAQQILGTRVSFKQLGIDNIKKSYFIKNYRNTKPISILANSLIEKGLLYEDEDEKIERIISKRDGVTPILVKVCKENYGELIKKYFYEKSGTSGIIIMDKKKYGEVKEIVKTLSIDVKLYTINQVKGLEFDNLLILDIDEIDYLKDYVNIEENANDEVAKQLYVSITRATTNLCMAYTKYNMDYFLDREFVVVDYE